MTRDEAINEIEKLDEWISKQPSLLEDWCKTTDALDMAIEALKLQDEIEEQLMNDKVRAMSFTFDKKSRK